MSEDAARQHDAEGDLAPTDIRHFEEQLLAQKEALKGRIATLQESLAAPDQYGEAMRERGDDATLLRTHDDAWDQLAFLQRELAQVDRALDRITAGTYGVSEVSGSRNPKERLEALPSATTLVNENPPE